jgi:hypothetical protein
MLPLLSPCRHSDYEAEVGEAAWRVASLVVSVVVEVGEAEPFSLSIVGFAVVFVERFLFHHLYCLRLEPKLMLKLSEEGVEAATPRYLHYSPRLPGWSCSRTPPGREPAIVVASSLFSAVRFVSRFESGGFICLD